ncbi:MAG: TonB-dependent receptor [Rhodoferax sp.]|nr:TonB-dependent receptor [Rhodoferax sp.]
MNTSPAQRCDTPLSQRRLFKLGPVAAGCAVMLLVSVSAQAQQAAPAAEPASANLSTVVITGIRKGIEDAISVKKNSDSIVEAISAEDIGKLPDVSIGESIARLPGLAAQRVAGRAQVISVRGLSPDFATTLLNGREQVSTGDNRSVEFDQYPSELLSGVTIYKTPDAGLIGQGLSGTMDMQTVRPLSFPGRTGTLNARGERNSLGSTANTSANGNRLSFSYIDQFANRTLGVAVGYSHLESPILEHQVGLYDPWEVKSRPGVPAGTSVMDGMKSLSRSGTNERDGLMAVVEWRPSKEWTSVLDVYTSKFKREETANQFEVNLGGWNGGNTPAFGYDSAVVNANHVLTGGVVSGAYPLVRGMYGDRKDTINALGWNNKFKLGSWSLLADVSYSKAKRDEVSLENNAQLRSATGGAQLDTLTLNWATGGFPLLKGGLNYSDPTQVIVGNTIYGSGWGKRPTVEDELKGFKLVGTLPLPGAMGGFFSDLDLGLNYAEREKGKRQPEGPINVVGSNFAISSDLQYTPVNLGFSGTGVIPAWNVPGVVGKYMTFNPTDSDAGWKAGKVWTVHEKVTTTFAKANIDTQLGSVSLRGNVGVQVQQVDQSSNSRVWDGTAPAGSEMKPNIDGKSYTDVLPSMNLVFGMANDQTVRIAMAKQVARPRVDQLSSAIEFGVDPVTFKPGGSGGNAKLDPWRANAFDVSYEKYFGTKAYVAVAAFYKDLKSYVYEQTQNDYDFSRFTPGTIAKTNLGSYKAPFNGQGGSLKGIELSASLPLNLVSPMLNGFGVTASFANSDSKIKIQDPGSNVGSDIPLPGLSKNVSNLTVYYEKDGFSTRISQRKRSDFVGEISNFAANRTLRYVVGENIVDFQVGYTFNEGSLKGLGLVLQVNNLNDAAYQTYSGTKDQPLEYIKYGRTVLFGANYKF